MPPSGFSQKAINGLLEFIQANYEQVRNTYGTAEEPAALDQAISELEKKAQSAATALGMPGVRGLATFMSENYRDLIEEITIGKKQPGYAMQKEIEDIRGYLADFHIEKVEG